MAGLESADPLGLLGMFLAYGMVIAVVILVLVLAMYVYMSLAFSAIAKKLNQSSPGLAWIPGVGPAIIMFKASNMHWWPWLLIIGYLIPVVGMFAGLVLMVYIYIWQWKMFEGLGKPGWWSLLCLITPVNLVLYGIAAWGK